MVFKRWYDHNPILKQIMEILEHANPDIQEDIVSDIIQIIISKQYDTDNFIQSIDNQIPLQRKRWYDEDETLHSAVEMLKNIDENDKKELLSEILSIIIRYNDEKMFENLEIKDIYS